MRKYISTYSNFLFEQDIPFADPAAPGGATKKEKPLHFIFLDDKDGLRKKKYPDGTSAVDYPAYSVSSTELEDWVKKNIMSTNKNNLTDFGIAYKNMKFFPLPRFFIPFLLCDKLRVKNESPLPNTRSIF